MIHQWFATSDGVATCNRCGLRVRYGVKFVTHGGGARHPRSDQYYTLRGSDEWTRSDGRGLPACKPR